MNIASYLREEQILLELETKEEPCPEHIGEKRWRRETKESVLAELADLLALSGRIGNRNRLLTDLVNRERKASTGIGEGIAIPHCRTIPAKAMGLAMARSTQGIDFEAIDKQPVHIFIAMVAPPYDDKAYLRLLRDIGAIFVQDWVLPALLTAESKDEFFQILKSVA